MIMYDLLCLCVFFPFILDVKFVGCTSRGHTGGMSHRISHPHTVCTWIISVVFVYVFFPLILDITSSLDVPAGVTQEEGHTGFFIHLLSAVRALIFLARRIQPFLSLVDLDVVY